MTLCFEGLLGKRGFFSGRYSFKEHGLVNGARRGWNYEWIWLAVAAKIVGRGKGGGSREMYIQKIAKKKNARITRSETKMKRKTSSGSFFSSEARWFAISFTLVEEDRKNRAGHESCCGSLHANP